MLSVRILALIALKAAAEAAVRGDHDTAKRKRADALRMLGA